MITVNVAMQQDKIIELLEGLDQGIKYSYKEKKGIKLFFEVDIDDLDAAAKMAKESIKAQPWGSVLFFQCTPV